MTWVAKLAKSFGKRTSTHKLRPKVPGDIRYRSGFRVLPDGVAVPDRFAEFGGR